MAFLISEVPSGEARRIALIDTTTTIGRHPECSVVIDEVAVSRHHAQITQKDDSYLLEDLNSRNGTFLNDKLIHQPTRLLPGDSIRICDSVFVFESEDGARWRGGSSRSSLLTDPASSVLIEDSRGDEMSSIMSQLEVSSHHASGSSVVSSPQAKLSALMEITRALSKTIAMEKVLPTVLDCLFELFQHADRGFIVLTDQQGNPVPLSMKLRREQDDERIRISRTIVNHVMNTKQAIISADAASDTRFDLSQSITDFRIRSLMCAPLIDAEGKSIGVIQLDTLRNTIGFQEEDLEVLATVAMQAGIAIDNAKLHQNELQQQTLRRDMELAQEVQRRLLPKVVPSVDGYEFFHFYRPAEKVGGDYFDFIPLADDRLAIIVADVVGHGIAAALLMAKFSAEARFALASSRSAAEAMTLLNRSIVNLDLDRFITVVLGILDASSNRLTVVNGGHLPPIVREADGTVTALDVNSSGLPVGLYEESQYSEVDIPIGEGDVFLLYTDGINESSDRDGNMFGNKRLMEDLRELPQSNPQAVGDEIVRRVQMHMGTSPQRDDICLVCFGRK